MRVCVCCVSVRARARVAYALAAARAGKARCYPRLHHTMGSHNTDKNTYNDVDYTQLLDDPHTTAKTLQYEAHTNAPK